MIVTGANIGQNYSARGLYQLAGEEPKTRNKNTERVYPNHHEELGVASESGSGASQVNDPLKLLNKYPDRRKVLEPLLREIQGRIEKYDPSSSKGLDLQGIDFTEFDSLRDGKNFQLNIERLLTTMAAGSKGLQYPLREANLRGANLYGAFLLGAYLYRANLSEANLREANLYRANLSEANLRGANLRGANLRGAILRGADLTRALQLAFLERASLEGASLEGANLEGEALKEFLLKSGAKIDESTRF